MADKPPSHWAAQGYARTANDARYQITEGAVQFYFDAGYADDAVEGGGGRCDLLRHDESLGDAIAFLGEPE